MTSLASGKVTDQVTWRQATIIGVNIIMPDLKTKRFEARTHDWLLAGRYMSTNISKNGQKLRNFHDLDAFFLL